MKKLILLFLVVCLFLAGDKESRAEDGDFMLWTELKYTHPFGESPWSLIWSTENRFDQDASHYMLFNTTLGFEYEVLKWFDAGFLFRVEKEISKPTELRPIPYATFSTKWGPVKFALRNRFEVRIFPSTDQYRFRYRARVKIGPKFKTQHASFNPFIFNEFFLETSKSPGGFNQNRAAVGNTFGFKKDKIKFTLYYLIRQDHKNEGWILRHVLGTGLAFTY